MERRSLALILVLFCFKASQGCELEAIMNSAITCGVDQANLFNITKYITYVEGLFDSAEQMNIDFDNITEFFVAHPIDGMLEMVGELEPAIVWLGASFYDEHLRPLVAEQYIRPMFGAMDNMDDVLTSSLNSHCAILNEFFTCLVTEMNTNCQKAADVVRLQDTFIDPIQGVFCNGAVVNSDSRKWLDDHSDGLTTAFSCIVDPTHPPERLEFIDFENHPVLRNIDFERVIMKCNAEGFGPGIEAWFENSGLEELFSDDFNVTTFNIIDVLDLGIPESFFALVRPMADCFIHEFLPIGGRLCPMLNITEQIVDFADVMRFIFPVFVEHQETIKQMVLHPLPQPNQAGEDRYTVALLGTGHLYEADEMKWIDSCITEAEDDKTLLFAFGRAQAYRYSGGDMLLENVMGGDVLFNTSGMFIMDYGIWPSIMVPLANATSWIYWDYSFPREFISTDNVTYMDFILPAYGVSISMQMPAGDNWAVFIRAAEGAYNLSYGIMARGCNQSGDAMGVVSSEASSAGPNCADPCSSIGPMADPCTYDCSKHSMEGMPAELTALETFHMDAKALDDDFINMVRNGGDKRRGKYEPCSTEGFINNVAIPCSEELMYDGVMPNLNFSGNPSLVAMIAEIGVLEPYALYGLSALINEFVIGPPAKSFMGIPSSEFTDFVNPDLIGATMERHCRFVRPMSECIGRRVADHCGMGEASKFIEYLEPLESRYCLGLDTVPSVNQGVLTEMLNARDSLMDELACFVNETNTAELVFDMNKTMSIYADLVTQCDWSSVFYHVSHMIIADKGDMLKQGEVLVELARNPARCALKIVQPYCPSVDISMFLDKLLMHLNIATGGVLKLDKEYFMPTMPVNYGSKKRVSMMAIGDPHIKALWNDKFVVCPATGHYTFFSSNEGGRFQIIVNSSRVSDMSEAATVIKGIFVYAWAPGALITDSPTASYSVLNGHLSPTFDQGVASIPLGTYDISITEDGNSVVIQHADTATFVFIHSYKDIFNLLVRTSYSYADTANGLLISGCNMDEGMDIEDFIDSLGLTPDGRRRKRSVSEEMCDQSCMSVGEMLRQQCLADCVVMQDTNITQVHMGALAADEALMALDALVEQWHPDLEPTARPTMRPTTPRLPFTPPTSPSATPAPKTCGLGAMIDSAIECGSMGTQFNITKYIAYIESLVKAAEDHDFSDGLEGIVDFFRKNPLNETLKVFGELEPSMVWMMSSFYNEHLKDRTSDQFLRPMFGDMSNMDTVLTDSVVSHCKIFDELFTCFIGKLETKCADAPRDVNRIKTMFMDPLQGRYCSGASLKQSSIDWLAANSAGLTSIFNCVLDQSQPPEVLAFIDFENNPLFKTLFLDLEWILGKCNAEAIGHGIEPWIHDSGILELFGDGFNFTTFGIFSVLDLNIPDSFLRFARPMADCMVHEFKPIPGRVCPQFNIDDQIQKFQTVMAFLFPIFVPEQTKIFDLLLRPRPQPNLAAPNRYSIGMVGYSHIYNTVNNGEWSDSCYSVYPEYPMLLVAFGGGAGYRYSNGDIWIFGLYHHGILFNNTGIYIKSEEWSDTLRKFSDIEYYWPSPRQYLIDTDSTTHFTFVLPFAGAFISLQNPTGTNWAVFVRASAGAHQLAFGALPQGCGSYGVESINFINYAAQYIPDYCEGLCTPLTSMKLPCEYDCMLSKNGTRAEMLALSNFDNKAKKFDRDAMNMASNIDGGIYTPCSTRGFISNVAGYCVYESMIYGVMPQLNFTSDTSLMEIITAIGTFEPYALYGMSALINEFVIGPPAKSFFGMPTEDFTEFVNIALVSATMSQHCKFVGPMTQCLERRMPEFCRGADDFKTSFLDPLNTRYCSVIDTTAPQINTATYNFMAGARDDLMNELSCFVNASNTAEFQFDMDKLMMVYTELGQRCGAQDVIDYATAMFSSEEGEILNQITTLVRVARNPMRCAVKVLGEHCPDMDVNAFVEKLVTHLNTATAGVFGIDKEYFINSQAINYGSKKRVSMWSVGDPHIKPLGSEEFTVCDAPGNVTYFTSDEGARFELKVLHDPANNMTNATVIRAIYIRAWEPDAAYSDDPALSYTVMNGTLKDTFDDGQTDVVVGTFSIFIETRRNGEVALINNVNSGTLIAITRYKTLFNLVMRTSESYAGTASGLLVSGCGLEGKNVSLLNDQETADENARRRKRATVTVDQCETACSSVSPTLRQQCEYDCLTMEDAEVGEAHNSAIEVEAEVVVEDAKIEIWLPDLDASTTMVPIPTVESSATNLFLSTCLLFVTTLLLLR